MVIIGCFEDSPTGTTNDDKLVGTWEMTAMTIDGDAHNIGQGFILVFRADGTGTASFVGVGSGPFEWSTAGDSLIMIADGDTETLAFSVTSTTLIIEFDDDDGHNVQTYTKREDTDNEDKEYDPDVIGTWNMISLTINGVETEYEETIYAYDANGYGAYSYGDDTGIFQWSTD